MSGSLAEWSTPAGSYRGKLLGMLAIRVFLLALESFYRAVAPGHANNKVSCDNKSTLYTFEKKSKQVTLSSRNPDVRRSLREVNKQATNKYQLEHVKGHQDRCKKQKNLTLEARLNIECDGMTKGAVRSAAQDPVRDWRQKLPLEYASVYTRGRNQTSDARNDLKQQIGKQNAKHFYTSRERSKGGMDEPTFSLIAWDDIDTAMRGSGKMYCLWYSKQGSGYYGVGHWTSRYKKGTNDRCPSCYQLDETADHLDRCKHAARTSIFEEQVYFINQWMETTYMDRGIQKWLISIFGDAINQISRLPRANNFKIMARGKAGIGWRGLTKGSASKQIRNI